MFLDSAIVTYFFYYMIIINNMCLACVNSIYVSGFVICDLILEKPYRHILCFENLVV